MKGDRRSGNNGKEFAARALAGLLALAALAAVGAMGGAARAAGPAPRVPEPTWTPANEWTIGGIYVETCSDPPVCGAMFGAPPADGRCRKVIALQILNGRYRNTDLRGLCPVVIIESPPGAHAMQANRAEWRRCDLLIPEDADSAQAAGLSACLSSMISGPDAPPFSNVIRAPLHAGITQEKVFVEAVGLLEMRLHPQKSFNGIRPPEIQNVAGPFPFLAIYYVYEPDTLFYGGAGEPWSWSKSSALTGQFVWTSQAAANQVKKAAEKAGEKPVGIRGKK